MSNKSQRKDDLEDPLMTSTRTRPPPKLEIEDVRLPVLKIERLKPEEGLVSQHSLPQEEDDEEEDDSNSLQLGPEGPSPPQLDKCIEDDNISVTSSSTTTTTKDDDKGYSIRSSQRNKNSSTHPKRLIQSIFAKPKKEKLKKRKAVKSKKSVKTKQYLQIKIAPGGFGRRQQQQQLTPDDDESENGDVGGMDVDDVDDSCGQSASDTGETSGRRLRSRGISGRPGGGGGDDSDEEDSKRRDEDNGGASSQQRSRGGDEANNEDHGRDSGKKSDDEDDGYREHEWKPVRAAMVAAMELVAKKQVTDDMRTERRIRKQICKPLPPRGRGRRAIFKKLNKPVKSYEHTTGPTVSDTAYYDNTFFHKGDIVCLIQDFLSWPRHPDLDQHRFFQINGFLKVPSMDDCVSLTLLKRVVPVPPPKPRPDPPTPASNVKKDAPDALKDSVKTSNDAADDEDDDFPYRFSLLDYRPTKTPEVMVVMSQLKFVMRCPPDFYYGHDIIFYKPGPSRIYTRLGRDLYEYDEETVSERNKRKISTSDNENDIDADADEPSPFPTNVPHDNNSNASNCNSVKGDDNESVVSSSNSNNSANINSLPNSHNSNGDSSNNCIVVPPIPIV